MREQIIIKKYLKKKKNKKNRISKYLVGHVGFNCLIPLATAMPPNHPN